MSELPTVRGSRDGQWVLCSVVSCGTRFAKVERSFHGFVTDLEAANDRADYLRRRGALPVERVHFGDGWYRDPEDVWRMDGRAWKSLSQGEGPKLRRVPAPFLRDRGYRPGAYRNRTSVEVSELPLEIVCPACGRRQIANPVIPVEPLLPRS